MNTLKRVVRIVAATILAAGIVAGTTSASDATVAKKPGGIVVTPMDTGW